MNLNVPDGTVKSGKELVEMAYELQDEEVNELINIHVQLQRKYMYKVATEENLDAMRDEYLTRLADIGILATVDVAPVLNGEPPAVEIVGKVKGDDIHKYGLDHEKKEWEVRKSKVRNEDYLGQKEPVNTRRDKKKK